MRYDLKGLSWHFIACSFNTHVLWGPKSSQEERNKNQWVGIHHMVSTKGDFQGSGELKALKNTVLHMQARP